MLPAKRDRTLVQRRRILLAGWLLANGAVVIRAVDVQVLESAMWRQAAAAQHQTMREVAAPRGRILDRNGVPLAETREVVKVNVAPREIEDAGHVRELLSDALGLTAAAARRHTDPADDWSVIPGTYDPTVLESLDGVRGVHLERRYQRLYPRGDLARGVLGAVIDGQGAGGVEEVFDQALSGQPGREIAARDHEGHEIPGEVLLLDSPVAGGDVRLTLDLGLQEIAHDALTAALDATGALGGDLLVTNPRTGEILAMVSAGGGRTDGLSSINAPYEPGSTLKPFTVAAILEHDVGSLQDLVDTGNGEWLVAGRRLSDTSAHGLVTLADALRVSSNVGVAKAAAALQPGQQYQTLRDFGFGVQSGVPLPGEAAGSLPRPEGWSGQSPASLAIGYEISVTPLQMAMAYGALANDGVLMEPRLVSEVRDNAGELVERPEPRAVRSVVSPEVAREIGSVLVEAVEEGTGTAARLEAFQVAGKTGTSRVAVNGRYQSGRYFSSFAAFFPAEAPQLVVFVKLDSPKGAYYGGATAAPVSRAMMEAALARAQTPLDRAALLESARRLPLTAPPAPRSQSLGAVPTVRFAAADLSPGSPLVRTAAAAQATERPALEEELPVRRWSDGSVAVPDVKGLAPREAVRRLHSAGLRVTWDGGITVTGTTPRAGSRTQPGDTVRLQTRGAPRP
jgi:cell division protein FtsI (penicillin-binding protein 3)